jgi:hypothetical protein
LLFDRYPVVMGRAYSAPRRRVNGLKRHNWKSRKTIRECDSAATPLGPNSARTWPGIGASEARRQTDLPPCLIEPDAAKFYCALAIPGLAEIGGFNLQAGKPACSEPWPALGDLDGNPQADRVKHAVELIFPAPLG